MIEKISNDVYQLVILKTLSGCGYSQFIDKEDIQHIKNVNMICRFRKDYKRKDKTF